MLLDDEDEDDFESRNDESVVVNNGRGRVVGLLAINGKGDDDLIESIEGELEFGGDIDIDIVEVVVVVVVVAFVVDDEVDADVEVND